MISSQQRMRWLDGITDTTFNFVVIIQSQSHIQLFLTPWTAAHQASLSFTTSWSFLRLCPLSWWCYLTISSSALNYLFFFLIAVLGLWCCVQVFSSCGVRASHCGGFSYCRAWVLGVQASIGVALSLRSCSPWALEHSLSCVSRAYFPAVCGIFLGQGSNLCPLH